MVVANGRNLDVHMTGVQRYTREILNCWSVHGDESRIISPLSPIYGFKGHLWEQLILPSKIKHNDILWSPSNTGPVLIKNQVVTIHDTVPFDHPEWLNKKFVAWYQFIQPKLVKSAYRIITISEFSKERIMHYLKVPESKIRVVYNGVDIANNNLMLPLDKLNIPFNRYLLSVGSIEPRKNISNLINAWLKINKNIDSDVGLVIVGAPGLSRVFESVESFKNLSEVNDRVHFTGHVSDDILHSLYKHALGFCYPSIYEGFGLPPIEAMCYGIPVLTSDTTAMSELCQDCAVLVNPVSVDDIADGILAMLSDNNQNRIMRGLELSRSLSWKTCAEQTWSAIHD